MFKRIRIYLPGLVVMHLITGFALLLSKLPPLQYLSLSMLTLSIMAGALFGNTIVLLTNQRYQPGIRLAQQNMLRWGVALYGLNLSLHQIMQVGPAAISIDILMVIGTVGIGWWIGTKILKMDPHTVLLTSAGSAICGAAAVVATEPVLKASAHKTAAAVGTVVLFGTLDMALYPLIDHYLNINPRIFGIYSGSTVHEVAQVVAIGKSIGEKVTDTAVIVKMIRVMLLAPFLFVINRYFSPSQTQPGAQKLAGIPPFALMFILIAIIHPYLPIPAPLLQALKTFDIYLLAMAMAALGLNTTLEKLRQSGPEALILGTILFFWLILGGGLINALVEQAAPHLQSLMHWKAF